MAYTLNISKKEFDMILEARRLLIPYYEAQELDCAQCKKEHPTNNIEADVRAKISLLNSYYSTRVKVKEMVANIVDLSQNHNLDNQIKDGNPDVVNQIAMTTRDNFSFATKYCALLQPDKFPIYDNYVWKFFSKLNRLGFFDKKTRKKIANVNKNASAAYQDYIDIYEEFINKSGLKPYVKNYREVDTFIWGSIKIYLLVERQSKHTTIQYIKEWLGVFFATLLANLMSSQIWSIISQIKF